MKTKRRSILVKKRRLSPEEVEKKEGELKKTKALRDRAARTRSRIRGPRRLSRRKRKKGTRANRKGGGGKEGGNLKTHKEDQRQTVAKKTRLQR